MERTFIVCPLCGLVYLILHRFGSQMVKYACPDRRCGYYSIRINGKETEVGLRAA